MILKLFFIIGGGHHMVGTRPSFRFMPRRVAAAGLVALALILAIPGILRASSSEWTLVQAEGDVQIQPAGSGWTPIAASYVVHAGSVLRTGQNGRAVLESGGDRIFVSPNSRLELPAGEQGGAVTHVRQSLGTMLYDIFTANDFATPVAERFRVDTPYLAAIIKGTTFTVAVGAEGAAVHVVKGVVKVTNALGRNAAWVYPGETAVVPPRPDGDVTVLGRDASTPHGGTADPIRNADSGVPAAATVAGAGLAGAATQPVSTVAASVGGTVSSVGGTLSGAGSTAGSVVGGAVSSVGGAVSSVSGTVSGAGAAASSVASAALPSAGSAASGTGGTLSNTLKSVLSGPGSGSLALGATKNPLGGIGGAIKP